MAIARADLLALLTEVVVGFAAAAVVGRLLLIVLAKLQLKQVAYEDAPETHQRKTGTPTMGGIAILAAVAIGFVSHDGLTLALLFLVIACAAIGFLDDYLSIKRGKNLGLRARTKYLATALVAIMFLRMAPGDTLFHAGSYSLIAPHWLWVFLGIAAITGTIHAVNLTDGLDGLAAGAILPPLAVLWFVATAAGVASGAAWTTTLALSIGGCLGFLLYNRYPARMIMGDTGSLALGALLSGAAILSGEMLLLLLIGFVFVAEALSVILQVTYFKMTKGKRIFRMSPLHHHFELSGWPEIRVTAMFWVASLAFSAIGLVIAR